jgi:uncharacterized protein (DUF697 family)
MRLFNRKSKWERLMDLAVAALANAQARRVAKVTLGVVGGAAAATAASAAVSSARHQDEK